MHVKVESKNNFYLHLDNANNELKNRQFLKAGVELWWNEQGWGMAPVPSVENLAILARQVAAFRYEDALFCLLAKSIGLLPKCLEYTGDVFNTQSNYKRSLLHPIFFERKGRNGGSVVRKQKLTSIEKWPGKKLSEIKLNNGEYLSEFHRKRSQEIEPDYSAGDATSWLKRIGKGKDYYPAFLSMFIAHAVLFEDYHGGESGNKLDSLTINLFEPVFIDLAKKFGVGPMVVKMPWTEELSWYPLNANWQEHGVVSL